MKKKKVLFLITKSNWGGAQRYVYDLATTLDTEKFEPVVALGGNGTLAELLGHAGIRTIFIPSLTRDVSLKNELRFIRDLWHIIRTERPHILHVNSSKAGAVGTLLGRMAFVPRVLFTAHGWAFNEDRPRWQKMVIKCIHAVTVLFSHRTIAVSRAIARELNWPIIRKKFKVINPGRNIGAMYTRAEARQALVQYAKTMTSVPTGILILTIAELHPIKRLSVLIEAFAQVVASRDVTLLIIGEGETRTELETLITANNLTDHVFLLGAIVEAARFLKAADVFILPSQSESYGYVVIEAGLAGVPIIASRVGGITDIIDDTTSVLVAPNDIEALTNAITSVLSDLPTAKERALKLQETLAKRTVGAMTAATTALYELPLK